jgi:ribose/xylose/arabinose/galactoside ABC-type transport system permease subunit
MTAPALKRKRTDDVALDTARSLTEFLAQYGIVLVLVFLVIGMTVLSPILRDGQQLFLTPRNIIQVMLQAAINAIIAVGMTFIITSGGIDLSVGSVVALCGVLAAMAMRDLNIGPLGGFIVAVVVGLFCGFFNGVLITRLNLSPFIATLGTMGVFRGIALVVSEGRSIYGYDRAFNDIFAGRIPLGGDIELPIAVIIAAVIALLFWFILTQTKLGKYTIAIGGNEETARVAGIPVQRYKIGLYVIVGVLTGIAGALLLARLNSGDPTFGGLFELNAIAAVVMGGTRLSGGQGSIAGTIVGALIISLVQNAMNIFNVPSYWQQVVIGTVIVFAVVLDQWRRKQSRY